MGFPTTFTNVSGTIGFRDARAANGAGGLAVNTRSSGILFSTNPLSWGAPATFLGSSLFIGGIAYSPELSGFTAYGSRKIATSTNGTVWTLQATNTTFELGDIAWAGSLGLFIGVGRAFATNSTALILTSPDGITWTQRGSFTNTRIFGVAWGISIGKALAVGVDDNTGIPQFFTSTDGINWTQAAQTGLFGQDVAWSPTLNLFAVAGNNLVDAFTVFSSPDAVTFTQRYGDQVTDFKRVSWMAGAATEYFVAVGANNAVYSSDGISWTLQDVTTANDGRQVSEVANIGSTLLFFSGSADFGALSGVVTTSAVPPLIPGAPFAIPWNPPPVAPFLDRPSNLYGFAGTVSGTVGNQSLINADLYGFSGNLIGEFGDSQGLIGSLYGFSGTVDGLGGAYANLVGFSATLGGFADIPESTGGVLYGFAGTVDAAFFDVAQFSGGLYGFAGTVGSISGATADLYGFSGTVDGNIALLGAAFSNLYGFAGTVSGSINAVTWLNGNLYGFAGNVDPVEPGYRGVLHGFSGTTQGLVLDVGQDGLVNANSHTVATVVNVRTNETTRYLNYQFKHLLVVGGKLYGVKTDGLYPFSADLDTDLGAPAKINGQIITKETDFGEFHAKRVPYCYLNSDTQTTITPVVDNVAKLPHLSHFKGRKTHLARGNSGRYWHYKIEQIERLEGVEFLPEKRQRRVK